MKYKRKLKRFLWALVGCFLLANAIAFMHAYKFTHFTNSSGKSTYEATALKKIYMLFTGVDNPRPVNKQLPDTAYQTILIRSNELLESWLIQTENAKGTIILFHGYGGEKSSMLDKAAAFRGLGFNTLVVDFMGSGGSEGNSTTIGYKEAEEVRDCFNFLKENGFENIHLFGTSMGAVAIMRALHEYDIKPASIIIECPFGTMTQTVKARFKMMGVPAFPMAHLLLFWGGVQNGFWAFSHNPVDYVKRITCPVLLLYGESDPKVSRAEIESIYTNIKGEKVLRTYRLAGHENYLIKYHDQWLEDVKSFLQ